LPVRPARPSLLRQWALAGLGFVRSRCFGAAVHEQMWTWFLPNPPNRDHREQSRTGTGH
jgi:hypothetical protein